MPYQDVPGARGVRQRPASEALADPDYEWITMPDGTIQGRRRAGLFTKALPYIVGGAMVAPHLLPLLGVGGAAGGAGGGSAAAAGGVPNLAGAAGVPGGAMYSAAASAPVGVGAAAGGAGIGSRILDWLKQPRNIAGLARAVPLGISALRGGFGSGGNDGASATETALLEEIRTNLGLQRARFQGAQPAFEAAQRMAVGMAPTQYRSGGPF